MMKFKLLVSVAVSGLLVAGLTTAAWAASPKMKMTTDIPVSITIADNVQTSIGSLEFFDGVPTGKTTESVNMPQSIIMSDGKKEMIL